MVYMVELLAHRPLIQVPTLHTLEKVASTADLSFIVVISLVIILVLCLTDVNFVGTPVYLLRWWFLVLTLFLMVAMAVVRLFFY